MPNADEPRPAYTLFDARSGHVIATADDEHVARRNVRDYLRDMGEAPWLAVAVLLPAGGATRLSGPHLLAWAVGERSLRSLTRARPERAATQRNGPTPR